jgi:hypothetical protein
MKNTRDLNSYLIILGENVFIETGKKITKKLQKQKSSLCVRSSAPAILDNWLMTANTDLYVLKLYKMILLQGCQ